MKTKTNNINSPVNTGSFDVSKLAEVAALLKQNNQSFFNTANKKEILSQYVGLLNEYAAALNIPLTVIKTTFKAATGLEYGDVMNRHQVANTPTMVA